MIKEKKKITKYNFKKSKQQILLEYLRTIACSVLVAFIITSSLAIKARSDMIKDLYANTDEQSRIDKVMAQQIIAQSDFTKDLQNKKYIVCMHVGELYETAGDYPNAQSAYEYALERVKPGVYKPYYKLICVLAAQEKFKEANDILNSLTDHTDKKLIKLKTRSYIVIGDKYYSIGKFLSAAKNYEQADFYYSKFVKKDNEIDKSIKKRIVNSYIQATDVLVKSGFNSEAVRFLKKAEKYDSDNFLIKYKLAIILSDADPEKAVEYFAPLLKKMPQNIDYGVYDNALMKAANIADLEGRPTKAKYYRYKIHSIDMFINRKVIYKNDIDTELTAFTVKKVLFTYPLKAVYTFRNISNADIFNLQGDFVLCRNEKPVETVHKTVADRDNPLYVLDTEPNNISIKFKKSIFTKKELEEYTVKIYLYKDEKYKTLAAETRIPKQSFNLNKK